MAQWWSDYLDQLREGGKVIPMKRGAKAGDAAQAVPGSNSCHHAGSGRAIDNVGHGCFSWILLAGHSAPTRVFGLLSESRPESLLESGSHARRVGGELQMPLARARNSKGEQDAMSLDFLLPLPVRFG